MNFRNTFSLEIPFELLINELEYYCLLFYYFLRFILTCLRHIFQNFNRNLLNNDFKNNIKRLQKRIQ